VQALWETAIDCPYCGAQFTALVDGSAGESDYIEDCPVCCQPIEFHLRTAADGELDVVVTRTDDVY
jgi:transcription elongation factor Elf1